MDEINDLVEMFENAQYAEIEAREALERAIIDAHVSGAINGKNKEARDVQEKEQTIAHRHVHDIESANLEAIKVRISLVKAFWYSQGVQN